MRPLGFCRSRVFGARSLCVEVFELQSPLVWGFFKPKTLENVASLGQCMSSVSTEK